MTGPAAAEPRRKGYLTGQQVAPILGVSASTVSRWAKDGKLPHSRTIGGHARFVESEIRALLASTAESATDTSGR